MAKFVPYDLVTGQLKNVPFDCRFLLIDALVNFANAFGFAEDVENLEWRMDSIRMQDGPKEEMEKYTRIIKTANDHIDYYSKKFIDSMNKFISCMQKEGKHLS
jgi:hypothetical protein